MQLPRLTTRRLLLAVAVAALLLVVGMEARSIYIRHARAQLLSSYLRAKVRAEQQALELRLSRVHSTPREAEEAKLDDERFRRKLEWHALLLRKYERLTRYPWLPVEPDPPEPE